jgi:hypothetical protein
MRPFGTLIEKTVKFREPTIPGARLERANPPVANRLIEGAADLFSHACVINDLDAAGDVVAMLEKWHARRSHGDEQQRRVAGIHLKRMQAELERRRIMRGNLHAGA